MLIIKNFLCLISVFIAYLNVFCVVDHIEVQGTVDKHLVEAQVRIK